MKKVLTIAGSDSCGGAGIQADIKTMDALGVYGMSVICAVTAQNTLGVSAVQEIEPGVVRAQLKAVFQDIPVDGVKIGMVSSSQIICTIREELQYFQAKNIVLDPVMVSKSGYFLLQQEAVEALKGLIAIADLVTPNIPEAEVLTGMTIKTLDDMKAAAREIQKLGPAHVLIKGGHRADDANDVLLSGDKFSILPGAKIVTANTHGTGCTLSSAIASLLARGHTIEEAVRAAKTYLTEAIRNSFSIGQGVGPVGHLINLYQKAGMSYE